MISFIIIGRNEETHLQRCFASVFLFIEHNSIGSYEVIYVDSDSSDSSIDIAKSFNANTILKITHGFNAAVARNLGAKHSNGNTLFFIDADMEIFKDFYNNAFESKKPKYPFLTGNFIYKYPDNKKVNYYKKSFNESFIVLSNGTFIIEKHIWNLIGGMDERFKKAQDFDFIMKATKKGLFLKRLEENIAVHNTIDYNHPARLWSMLKANLYVRSLLYRKHFFSKYTWPVFLRREYTLIMLIFSTLLYMATSFLYVFLAYAIFIVIKSLVQKKRPWFEFFLRLPYYIIRDINTLIGFFFFHPAKPASIKWQKLTGKE